MNVCFTFVDPQVEAIIKAAVEGAKPFWAGLLIAGKEIAHRRPVYFEPGDRPALYFNCHDIQWDPVKVACVVEELGLAKTKTGPWISPLARLTWDGQPRSPELCPGDAIGVLRGHLVVEGNLP